jgi:NADP-dependent aldehyde dehydrogenase
MLCADAPASGLAGLGFGPAQTKKDRMSTIASVNPATGEVTDGANATGEAEVAAIVERAAAAAAPFEALGRTFRAAMLRAVAEELEARREEIIETGKRETALSSDRLNGELTRTTYQARFFANVIEEGAYLEATIDHAGGTPMGPGPDLRRMLIPLGTVAVFGASNFPLAFSVPGGDTISALAAGNPVVVKAHSSHPALSLLCYEAIKAAARRTGAPAGVIGIVFGTEAGAALVAHPAVRAVGFTGSLRGGQALMDIIAGRDEPIPFYGELSSLNPMIITERALQARAEEIAEGIVASVTGSAGQLCTKPGLVFVPHGEAGDDLVNRVADLFNELPAAALLDERISSAYEEVHEQITGLDHVTGLGIGLPKPDGGFFVRPRVVSVDAADIQGPELEECFGPSAVIARYQASSLEQALALLPSSLTATIHAEPDETAITVDLTNKMRSHAGRLLYNQYPTGVLVSWAQHHGGPWPSTNTLHTSVGATAIRRFLRPLTWQGAPDAVLPEELLDRNNSLVRRVDGVLRLPAPA